MKFLYFYKYWNPQDYKTNISAFGQKHCSIYQILYWCQCCRSVGAVENSTLINNVSVCSLLTEPSYEQAHHGCLGCNDTTDDSESLLEILNLVSLQDSSYTQTVYLTQLQLQSSTEVDTLNATDGHLVVRSKGTQS